jgi:isoquinoline 1-oxidoreductase alpha subunit
VRVKQKESAMLTLRVNGRTYQVEAEPATPLLWVLRDHLGLTGTKYGCGIAQCGACTVHVDGRATRACVLPVSAVLTSHITTIEGLSPDGQHPVQRAWVEHDVPQCGYCQSGQIMAVAALLARSPNPSTSDITREITNICRCGTYQRIQTAIRLAAELAKG